MTQSQLKVKVISLVKNILYAKRNNDMKTEQTYIDKLTDLCLKYNINYDNAYQGAVKELKNSVAAIMNGIV